MKPDNSVSRDTIIRCLGTVMSYAGIDYKTFIYMSADLRKGSLRHSMMTSSIRSLKLRHRFLCPSHVNKDKK